MPLKPTKRSVLFHKGLSDGADRFLLEPPSIDYAENLTLGKDGSFSKRLGFTHITSVDNPDGEPFFLHSIQDDLYTLTGESIKYYDGVSWNPIESNGFIGSSSLEIETNPLTGLAMPQFAKSSTGPVESPIIRQFIAYEVQEKTYVRNHWQVPNPNLNRHILIGVYDEEGHFLTQYRIDNAHSPQLVRTTIGATDIRVFLFYTEIDTTSLRHPLRMRDLNSAPLADIPLLLPVFVDANHGYPIVRQDTFTERSPRLGQGADFEARFHVAWSTAEQLFSVVYQNDRVSYLTAISTSGFRSPISERLIPNYYGVTPLGIEVVDVGSTARVYVLYAYWDTVRPSGTPTHFWSVGIWYGVIDTVQPTFYTAQGEQALALGNHNSNVELPASGEYAQTPIHGTICSNQASVTNDIELFVAWTNAGKTSYVNNITGLDSMGGSLESRWFNARDIEAGIRWSIWSMHQTPSQIDSGVVRGHRIATNAVYLTDRWYVGLQQWADYTPYVRDLATVEHNFVEILAAIKPVTTALCGFKANSKVARPIATIDAGQSQVCDYIESEVKTHLATLLVENGEFLVCNRVIQAPADISFRLNIDNAWIRRVDAAVWSTALCRIHRVKRGAANTTVHSEPLGDGIFISTALPMWLDRGFYAEFSPLDSPEIIAVIPTVRDIGDARMLSQGETAMNEGAASDDETIWRKFSVVVGYMDSQGNAHRSAPSTTLYVQNPYGEHLLYVTPPLSVLPSVREYWCEVYASNTADTDLRLVASTVYQGGKSDIEPIVCQVRVVTLGTTPPTYPPSSSPLLYTEGGILAADPWPIVRQTVATSTRLWGLDSIHHGRVIYSKLFDDYVAPEYNSTLVINLGDERDLTAIGKLDDKVIIFEPNDIHVIYGDGPDNRGQGQEFAVHYISTDVGCQDQKSIIETPAGLVFYSSPRGFYLLDRNLQIQFIGAAIEDIARGIRVKAATLDPGNAEVRFLVEPDPNATQTVKYGPDADTTAITRPPRPVFGNPLPTPQDENCLVFYYETGDWMLYTNYPGEAACIYQRRYTRLLDDWSIWQESEEYSDPTGTNRTLLRSPWLKLSETIQDYNRLWRITILGRYLSSLRGIGDEIYEAGDVVVRLYFDYEAFPAQEKRFRVQDFGFNVWNQTLKRAERFQFKIHPKRGRAQAVKLEIEEVNSEDLGEGISYGLGAGFEIVSADLFVGVGPTRSLLPQAVKM